MSELSINPPSAEPTANGTVEATGAPTEVTRPDFLLEKFTSVEDQAKAYVELEKKLGASTPKIPEAAPAASSGDSSDLETIIGQAVNAFANDGSIPQDIMDQAKAQGVAPSLFEEVVTGRKAQGDAYSQRLMDTVGGEESWKAIRDWAGNTMGPEEQKAFNDAIASGDEGRAKLALYGVQAKYNEANSNPRQDLQIPGTTAGGGATGFGSVSEMLAMQSDPKYSTDESFRRHFELKLKATSQQVLATL